MPCFMFDEYGAEPTVFLDVLTEMRFDTYVQMMLNTTAVKVCV